MFSKKKNLKHTIKCCFMHWNLAISSCLDSSFKYTYFYCVLYGTMLWIKGKNFSDLVWTNKNTYTSIFILLMHFIQRKYICIFKSSSGALTTWLTEANIVSIGTWNWDWMGFYLLKYIHRKFNEWHCYFWLSSSPLFKNITVNLVLLPL